MPNDQKETIAERFVSESKFDWGQLTHLYYGVLEEFPNISEYEAKNITLDLVRMVIKMGMIAGDVDKSGFTAWSEQDPDSIVQRIDCEWQKLGHPPVFGDIVWFDFSPEPSEIN